MNILTFRVPKKMSKGFPFQDALDRARMDARGIQELMERRGIPGRVPTIDTIWKWARGERKAQAGVYLALFLIAHMTPDQLDELISKPS